jgi:hypothetical protein
MRVFAEMSIKFQNASRGSDGWVGINQMSIKLSVGGHLRKVDQQIGYIFLSVFIWRCAVLLPKFC